MGLPEERGTPKDLSRLFESTYQLIRADSPRNTEQRYLELLETEERWVAWERAIN